MYILWTNVCRDAQISVFFVTVYVTAFSFWCVLFGFGFLGPYGTIASRSITGERITKATAAAPRRIVVVLFFILTIYLLFSFVLQIVDDFFETKVDEKVLLDFAESLDEAYSPRLEGAFNSCGDVLFVFRKFSVETTYIRNAFEFLVEDLSFVNINTQHLPWTFILFLEGQHFEQIQSL